MMIVWLMIMEIPAPHTTTIVRRVVANMTRLLLFLEKHAVPVEEGPQT